MKKDYTEENQMAKVHIDTTSNRFYVIQNGKQIAWYYQASIAYMKVQQINNKL